MDLLSHPQKLVPNNAQQGRLHRIQKRSANVTLPLSYFWDLIFASAGIRNHHQLPYTEILAQAYTGNATAPASKSSVNQSTERVTTEQKQYFGNLVEAVESFNPYHELSIPDYGSILKNGIHFSLPSGFSQKPKLREFQFEEDRTERALEKHSNEITKDTTILQAKYVPFSSKKIK